MRRISSALFLLGLGLLIAMIFQTMEFGSVAPLVGQAINATAAEQVGAANFVTSVVLGYRGFDTLLELTILFTAATAGGLVLGKPRAGAARDPDSGFILRAGADKVSVNSAAVRQPELIDELATRFGSQFLTIAIDANGDIGIAQFFQKPLGLLRGPIAVHPVDRNGFRNFHDDRMLYPARRTPTRPEINDNAFILLYGFVKIIISIIYFQRILVR